MTFVGPLDSVDALLDEKRTEAEIFLADHGATPDEIAATLAMQDGWIAETRAEIAAWLAAGAPMKPTEPRH